MTSTISIQVNDCLVVRSKSATLELKTNFKKIDAFLTRKSNLRCELFIPRFMDSALDSSMPISIIAKGKVRGQKI